MGECVSSIGPPAGLAALLEQLTLDVVRFEVMGEPLLAIPQQDWMTAEASIDLRKLHRHVVGRLQIGDTHYVVFAEDTASAEQSPNPSVAQILTRRELQVALLIAEGMADKQIARRLGISGHTVREHLRRACAKMNTSKRSALVAMLYNHGNGQSNGHDT